MATASGQKLTPSETHQPGRKPAEDQYLHHLDAEPAAGAGDRPVCDGVGDAAPAALGAGAPGPGPAGRAGRGGRDLPGRGGAGRRGGPGEGQEGPHRHRGGGQTAEGDGRRRMAILADGSSASLHPFVTANVEPGRPSSATPGWATTGWPGSATFTSGAASGVPAPAAMCPRLPRA